LPALQAADILAWDIDFNTDLRTGDTFRIIVEGLYSDLLSALSVSETQ